MCRNIRPLFNFEPPANEEEVRAAKRAYGWPEERRFYVPEEVLAHFRQGIGARGRRLREAWEAAFAQYKGKYPELARQLELMAARELPEGWDRDLPRFDADAKGLASRASSGVISAMGAGSR